MKRTALRLYASASDSKRTLGKHNARRIPATLHDNDFNQWVGAQVEALRAGRFEDLDLPHVIEELDALGISQRHAIESQLRRLWHHLLKRQYQPQKRSRSWDNTIDDALQQIFVILRDSPSLRRDMSSFAAAAYGPARRKAARETGLTPTDLPIALPVEFTSIAEALAKAQTDHDLDALIRTILDA